MSVSKATGPRFLETHVAAKVRPATSERYRAALLPFCEWSVSEGFHPESAEEWDDILAEYVRAHPQLRRTKFADVVAGTEYFFSRLRHKLSWSHAILTGWAAGSTIRHTIPLGKGVSKLICTHFVTWGYARLGVAIVLQCHTGLRPSELLRLRREDFLFPEEEGFTRLERPLRISLGTRVGTKVQRPQVTLLDRKQVWLYQVMKVLKLCTPPGLLVFPFSYSTYRTLIKRAELQLNVVVGWTPHSPRAGFASDSRAEGWSFEELREAGRWSADSSLRCYLDIVGSSGVEVALIVNIFLVCQIN